MSKSDASAALKKLTRERLDPARIAELVDEINAGTDRSVAIVWGAMVEDALQTSVIRATSHLSELEHEKLFSLKGKLSNFAKVINEAFSLKAITEEQASDLHLVREIRNAFAHGILDLSFNTQEVKDICSYISFAETFKHRSDVDYRMVYSVACLMLWQVLGPCGMVMGVSSKGFHGFPGGLKIEVGEEEEAP